ncbi:hypothetical protein BDZ45DRAFT_735163 [Acephala macrosclerotiorum]|nr:hypothetical protein BDZ45DRAFT_735163 [Acephala macrosclerotiorum]
MYPNYVRLYAFTLQGRKRRPIIESGDMAHPGTIVTLNRKSSVECSVSGVWTVTTLTHRTAEVFKVPLSVKLSQAPTHCTVHSVLPASDRHPRFSLASTSSQPGGNNAEATRKIDAWGCPFVLLGHGQGSYSHSEKRSKLATSVDSKLFLFGTCLRELPFSELQLVSRSLAL